MAEPLESCKFDTYSSNTCSLVWMFLLFTLGSRRFPGMTSSLPLCAYSLMFVFLLRAIGCILTAPETTPR